jgi:uncharacterized protein (TIGR03435 family)
LIEQQQKDFFAVQGVGSDNSWKHFANTRTFHMNKRLASIALLALALPIGIIAQKPPIVFEVASIKPSAPDSRGGRNFMEGSCHGSDTDFDSILHIPSSAPQGRCLFNGITLKMLIVWAYNLPLVPPDRLDQMIIGGPGWTGSDTFFVDARAENPSTTTRDQLLLMLRELLAERFGLAVHRETKEVSGYMLVVAKNGPKLKEPQDKEHQRLGMKLGGPLTGANASMSMLASALSDRLGRPVLDKTQLAGNYDFTLAWTPGDNEVGPRLPPGQSADLFAPSLFTALQEQLGLRLESQRVPIEFLIVDHAERPSEN